MFATCQQVILAPPEQLQYKKTAPCEWIAGAPFCFLAQLRSGIHGTALTDRITLHVLHAQFLQ